MVGFLLVNLKDVPVETYNIGNPKPEISMLDLVTLAARTVPALAATEKAMASRK